MALPYPRSLPTRPAAPLTSGASPGSTGLATPSEQLIHSASAQNPLVAAPARSEVASFDALSSLTRCPICDRGPSESPSPTAEPRREALSRRCPSTCIRVALNSWRPSRLATATQNSRCRMCGAPTLAAHRSADPTAYPNVSRSADTASSQYRPDLLATCSPKMTEGRHSRMRANQAGQRWRASSSPVRAPAALKGWQGHDPVQTGRSSGHPASLSACDQTPIPAKK